MRGVISRGNLADSIIGAESCSSSRSPGRRCGGAAGL